jgi:hypothetical protein
MFKQILLKVKDNVYDKLFFISYSASNMTPGVLFSRSYEYLVKLQAWFELNN